MVTAGLRVTAISAAAAWISTTAARTMVTPGEAATRTSPPLVQ